MYHSLPHPLFCIYFYEFSLSLSPTLSLSHSPHLSLSDALNKGCGRGRGKEQVFNQKGQGQQRGRKGWGKIKDTGRMKDRDIEN